MRKLLLASAAMLSASLGLADLAHAQAFNQASMDQSGMDDGQAATPAPGTISVRLNGRFRFYAGYFDDKDYRGQTATNTTKQNTYGFAEYARLYPGFDGVASNGLKYGAALEIRQDNTVAAGGGVNGSPSQADRGQGTLYLRRAFGYLGANKFGTLRFGATDSPSSLYLTGTVENFDAGGWNGDVYYQLAGNSQLNYPFADVGNFYSTSKVVYLSPQFMGFDFGASWEPNTNNSNIDDGNCGSANTANTSTQTTSTGSTVTIPLANGAVYGTDAGVGCARTSSTNVAGETSRRVNTTDVLLRYRGTFGPVGLAATGSYIHSGNVKYNGQATLTAAQRFSGLDMFDTGVAVTYAGFSLQGNFQRGRYTGQFALDTQGGAVGSAWVAGATYTVGPLIFGGSWIDYTYQGNLAQTGISQARDQGAAAGATYALAPGVSLFLSYIWDQRKQGGVNIATNTVSPTGNKLRAQALALGTGLSW